VRKKREGPEWPHVAARHVRDARDHRSQQLDRRPDERRREERRRERETLTERMRFDI
jgi:hypothetical protein